MVIPCRACRTFAAETAIGDTPLCHLCHHAVAVHGAALEDAPAHECEHTAHEIYPPRSRVADALQMQDAHARATGGCCRWDHDRDGRCDRHPV